MNKTMKIWLSVIMLFVVMLSGCASPAATTSAAETPAEAEVSASTEAPAATEVFAPTTEVAPTEEIATRTATSNVLILATTTSTQDSGLLDVLVPEFEAEFGVEVDVIAVGTGQALTLGQDGNADVLLVHSRAKEDEFMAAGHGVRREDVMYNDFVILGPENDPAGIKGMTNAVDAFKKIAETQSEFLSRGDDSGTHTKELSIWKKAEIEPTGDWYISTGQGMGEVLTMTNEQQGYTLSDRATYLARTKEGLDLVVLVEGDKDLFNPYGVIAVNPEKGTFINADLATKFIDWIISVPVQEKIASFGLEEFGQSLFIPDSKPWKDAKAAEQTTAAAGLKISGLLAAEKTWSVDELKAMETMTVDYTNKDNETNSYTGVSINQLLDLAGLNAEAATLTFVAGDGYTADADLAEIRACTDCIVAFMDDGSLRTVLPNFKSGQQVKGVIEIQVK
ncbi:MAG: substrate-binding domain-containing protein [Chloroflexi bacterium]|nr:substrate-binding domain-containing protein [Chloroflexota bacterium]